MYSQVLHGIGVQCVHVLMCKTARDSTFTMISRLCVLHGGPLVSTEVTEAENLLHCNILKNEKTA